MIDISLVIGIVLSAGLFIFCIVLIVRNIINFIKKPSPYKGVIEERVALGNGSVIKIVKSTVASCPYVEEIHSKKNGSRNVVYSVQFSLADKVEEGWVVFNLSSSATSSNGTKVNHITWRLPGIALEG
ncbi:MAG: hypothetical protein PQJ59_08750 [Spirochaetales bacterium]|nr:hypothetical protein [Spirochaetales bacterium]